MTLNFIKNIKLDAQNWQNAVKIQSYGVDWKKYIPADLSIKCIETTGCLTAYLQSHYYAAGLLDVYLKKLQEQVNTLEIKNDLEILMDRKFPEQIKINVFITTFSRCPYDINENFFYLRFRQGAEGPKKTITNIYHELMHFLFHRYYWNICEKSGLNNKEIHTLKESLTILLNLILKQRKLPLDVGYSTHQELRAKLEKLWRRENGFDKFIEKAIKIIK